MIYSQSFDYSFIELSNKNVYSIIEDKNNNILCLADGVVYKKKGSKFIPIEETVGLNIDFFDMFCDSNNNIYLSSFNSNLYYLDSSLRVCKIINPNKSQTRFFSDSKNNVFFNNSYAGISKIKRKKNKINSFEILGKKSFFIINIFDSLFLTRGNGAKNIFFLLNENFKIIDSTELNISKSYRYFGLPLAKLYLSGSINKEQLSLYSHLPHNAIHLSKDRDKVIVFINNEIVVFDFKGNTYPKISNILSQLNFTQNNFGGLFIDSKENIWLTNLDKGIYHIPFYYKHISIIEKDNIVYSHNNKELIFFKKGNIYKKFNFEENEIKSLQKYGDSLFVIKKSGLNHSIINLKNYQDYKFPFHEHSLNTAPINDSLYLVLQNKFTDIIDIKTNKKKVIKRLDIYKPNTLLIDKNNIYIASDNELIKCNLFNDSVDTLINKKLNITTLSIINSKLLVGTKGYGLYLFHNDSLNPINTLGNDIRNISTSNKNLILKTNYGIEVINKNFKALNHFEFSEVFKTNYNYFSDNDTSFSFIDFKGNINEVDVNFSYPKIDLSISLTHPHDVNSNTFKYNSELNFNILPSSLSYLGSYEFYYYLNDSNKMENITSQKINFKNLTYGDYSLFIKAYSINKNYQSDWVNYKFTIEKPFYLKPLSIILAILTVISITSVFILLLVRSKNNKIKRIKEDYNIKLQSIQNQLNPHFLSNALMNLQILFLNNEPKQANKYLANIGALSREVLNSSKKTIWTLEEEIKLLKLYCEVEKVKFKNNLVTNFIYDKNIIDKQNLTIPTMLIQPLIENSIKHGTLINKTLIINVFINYKENNLSVIVEDNGPTIKETKQINFSNGNGIRLINEKINLIKKLHHIHIDFNISLINKKVIAKIIIPQKKEYPSIPSKHHN